MLQAKLRAQCCGKYEAEIHTVLAPLGRPLDVHLSGRGKVYICEVFARHKPYRLLCHARKDSRARRQPASP